MLSFKGPPRAPPGGICPLAKSQEKQRMKERQGQLDSGTGRNSIERSEPVHFQELGREAEVSSGREEPCQH